MRIIIFNFFLIVFILQSIASCSVSTQKKSFIEFPERENIAWGYYDTENILPLSHNILQVDSCLYVLGQNNNKWLHKYNINNCCYINSYIKTGNTQNDILNASKLYYNYLDNTFNIFDSEKHYTKSYSNDFNCIAINAIDTTFRTINGIFPISQSVFIIDAPVFFQNKFMGHSGIYAVNPITHEIISDFLEYPKDSLITASHHRSIKNFSFNRDNSRFAVVYPQSTRFSLYELSGNGQIKQICSHEYFASDSEIQLGNFRTLACSDNYVYISYTDSILGSPVTKIGIWDWNGNATKEICTDKDIVSFTVSSDDSEIFAIIYDVDINYQLAQLRLK